MMTEMKEQLNVCRETGEGGVTEMQDLSPTIANFSPSTLLTHSVCRGADLRLGSQIWNLELGPGLWCPVMLSKDMTITRALDF